ncbi:unnamed protein product [Spirodela intermedia]|uniref:Uncharacterized protein n=1 Tax=Spirodela intermedia TaxID=51605 RepID=A0A7I8JCA5_SPIIN|nr:unnamed protein product [Spirodela intermedia]CAA6667784.1 unnamed protein product [Spirodela intermedia]
MAVSLQMEKKTRTRALLGKAVGSFCTVCFVLGLLLSGRMWTTLLKGRRSGQKTSTISERTASRGT